MPVLHAGSGSIDRLCGVGPRLSTDKLAFLSTPAERA
jgi:hypothetical protein